MSGGRASLGLVWLAVAALGAAAAPSRASAQATAPDPDETPMSPTAGTSAVGGAVALGYGLAMLIDPEASPATIAIAGLPPRSAWRGGILFDEEFRSATRLSEVPAQETARRISDVMLFATMIDAAAIDAALVPALQGDSNLAWQASMAHALALGLTLSAGEIAKTTVGRARPFERDCQSDPQRTGCSDSDAYHSFFSLHTAMAFTSAGFSCAMHASRSLYGDPTADAMGCLTPVLMASATGLLRVLSDRHYISDVLVGAAIGFLVGYLVPLAIVPERGERASAGEPEASQGATWALAPLISAMPGSSGSGGTLGAGTLGVSAFGAF